MSLVDDVERARKVDEAINTLRVYLYDNGAVAAPVGLLDEEIIRLTIENQKYRDALVDIAKAHPSECDQTPYWAQRALCAHEKRERNERGEMACVECWDVEGET